MKGNRNWIRNVSAPGAAVSFPFNWNLELELGTWNLEPGTWNLELGTWNFR
jgi:hypothetical protein